VSAAAQSECRLKGKHSINFSITIVILITKFETSPKR
jgi:hypothetical protein